MTKASDNLFPGIILRESADDGSDFSSPSADYRRLFLGEDGDLHLKDSSGTVTDIGGSGGGLTATDLSPTADTWIDQAAATTNYGSDTQLSIADRISSPGGFTKCPILTFDLSGLSGEVVRADLMLYGDGSGNAGIFTGHIGARKVIRSGVNLAQATWNVYSTGNNWGTAGARGTGDTAQMFEGVAVWSSPANQSALWFALDLTGMVRRAIMDSETSLTVLVGAIDIATGSQNALTFSSVDHATAGQRPRLSVVSG